MFVRIGDTREVSDVVDLLLECHTRIRLFTALAARLGGARGVSHGEIQDTAFRVRRYFSEALPLHVADEEDSIFPRLAGEDQNLELQAALNRMKQEHTAHEPLICSLVATCRILEDNPDRHNECQQDLLSTASALDREFAVHLEQEEKLIFPAVRKLVTLRELETIQHELRARRKLGSPNDPF